MNILIVGGGTTASNLIKLILADRSRHAEVHVIEINHAVCQRLANAHPIQVYNGDGTNIDILKMAGCDKADIFVSLTSKDEDNLIACQLAKRVFNIRTPICRVNNPRNIETIQKLGIHNTFSASVLLAKVLNQEIDYSGLYIVYDIPGDTKVIVEFMLRPDAEVCGKSLIECSFPGESRIVLVVHNNMQTELASGSTILRPHDRIMMVCDYEDFTSIQSRFVENQMSGNKASLATEHQNEELPDILDKLIKTEDDKGSEEVPHGEKSRRS